MASYPDAIYSPRAKENRSGVEYEPLKKSVIFVEDVVYDDNEIVAIETELGLNPRGSYGSVAAYLAALNAKTIFDKYFDLVHWNSIDGFTVVKNAAGVAVPIDAEVQLETIATINDKTIIKSGGYYRAMAEAGKVLTIDFVITYLSSIASVTHWLYFCYPTSDPPWDEDDGIGFKIVNGEVFANNGDNIDKTQTTTGVTLSAGNQRTRLRIVFTPGTNCKFYVNDVLKVTHTTRLTTKDQLKVYLGVKTGENVLKNIYLGRVLIEKVY